MIVVGVDGRRPGWISVVLDSGRFAGASRFASFRQLVDCVSDALAIMINLPLGLVDEGVRECDRLARQLVAPQVDRILPAPPRSAITAASFSQARSICYHSAGWLLSEEAYRIRDKVLELSEVLTRLTAQDPSCGRQPRHGPPGTPGRRQTLPPKGRMRRDTMPLRGLRAAGRFAEARPELSYRELAGHTVRPDPRSSEGILVRTKLLRQGGVDIPAVQTTIGGVAPGDVLDAAALAWTAERYARGRAYSLPANDAWQLDGNRLLALWV